LESDYPIELIYGHWYSDVYIDINQYLYYFGHIYEHPNELCDCIEHPNIVLHRLCDCCRYRQQQCDCSRDRDSLVDLHPDWNPVLYPDLHPHPDPDWYSDRDSFSDRDSCHPISYRDGSCLHWIHGHSVLLNS